MNARFPTSGDPAELTTVHAHPLSVGGGAGGIPASPSHGATSSVTAMSGDEGCESTKCSMTDVVDATLGAFSANDTVPVPPGPTDAGLIAPTLTPFDPSSVRSFHVELPVLVHDTVTLADSALHVEGATVT
jgi:hypothetical protein